MNASSNIESNIPKLIADRFICNLWLISPVLVLLYESKGLAASQIYLVQGIFSVAFGLFEIPTGYFSDVLGRKRSLLCGAALIPIGVLVYMLAEGFWGFVAAEVIIALGISLRSGADSAMLYDTLLALKRTKEHKKIEGRGIFAERCGNAISAILGGWLGSFSLALPFIVKIFSSLLLLPLVWSMQEPTRKKQEHEGMNKHALALWAAVNYCARHSVIRAICALSALLLAVNMTAYWSYFLYYKQIGLEVALYGVVAASASFICGMGGQVAHRIEKRIGLRWALSLTLMSCFGFVGLGAEQSVYALPCIALNAFAWGVSMPLLRDLAHRHASSDIRATVLSAISMAGRALFFLVALGVGALVEAYTLSFGFFVLAAITAVVGALSVFLLMRALAREGA